jgi:hypothetical protein
MKFNSQSFPYPILTPADAGNDYINGSFECVLKFNEALSEDLQIELHYSCMLSVEEIFEEIETGKANYALEINCPETLYRRVILLERRGVIHLDATELHGKVTFTPFVVAREEIHNFKSVDFNPEYEEQSFDLLTGDILASDISVVQYVEFSQLAMDTLVKIRTDYNLPPMLYSIDPTPSYLYISMGENLRSLWTEIGKDKGIQPYFAMSIYKDCIYVAVEELIANEEAESQQWARALRNKIGEMKISLPSEPDFNEINLISQKLVQNVGIDKILKLKGAK